MQGELEGLGPFFVPSSKSFNLKEKEGERGCVTEILIFKGENLGSFRWCFHSEVGTVECVGH